MSAAVIPEGSWVAIFHALHRVMGAEAALVAARVPHRLLTTPRPLRSSCGLAIVLPADALDDAERALGERELAIVELHRRVESGYELVRERQEELRS